MKQTTLNIFEELFIRYPALKSSRENILNAFCAIKKAYENGGTLYCCGNGGSSSDSEHIVGELLKTFKKRRNIDEQTSKKLKDFGEDGEFLLNNLEGSLPAVSLTSQTATLTAFANDKSWEVTFAQQLYGLGKAGDCLFVISTSGNSKNCVYATLIAKTKGINTIALTGESGGRLSKICDVCICVPEKETYKVQELHLPVYHCLCSMLEEELFD